MRASRASGGQDYAIGRGKPPPEYTWKPGQSGNCRGRPKGRKNEATIWREILDRKIKMMIAGRLRTVTVQEGMQYRIAHDGLGGNLKSAAFALNRREMFDSATTSSSETHEDDRAVLEAYLRRLRDESSED